MAAKCMVNIL